MIILGQFKIIDYFKLTYYLFCNHISSCAVICLRNFRKRFYELFPGLVVLKSITQDILLFYFPKL